MIDLEHLRQYSLFGGLSERTLGLLKQLMRRRDFNRGEVLFRRGDRGDEVCFLLEGSVRVEVDGHVLAHIQEGQQFGEMHLIDIMPRSADVIGDQDGDLYILNNSDLLSIKRYNPEAFIMLVMNCSRDISRRLRVMNERYVELLR